MFWYIVGQISTTTRNLRDWANRNRKKIIIAGVITGSSALVIYLIRSKLKQIEQPKSNQNEVAVEKLRLQQYFQNAQKSCNSMITSDIIPNIQTKLVEFIAVPSKSALRSSLKAAPEEKMALWQLAKLQSFVRVISGIYASSLMILFTRIEVNILGRYMYMDTVFANNATEPEEKPIGPKVQQKYLINANSGYIMDKGLQKLVTFITNHVKNEMDNWPLTKKCTFDDMTTLFKNIRTRIESDVNENPHIDGSKFRDFLMENNIVEDLQLQALLNETRDVLDSKQFETILKTLVDQAFHRLEENIKVNFEAKPQDVSQSQDTTTDISKDVVTIPLAKISPLVKKQFKILLEIGEKETNLIQSLFNSKQLEDYAYYVFTSSYDEDY